MTSGVEAVRRSTRLWRALKLNFFLQWMDDETYLRWLYRSRFGARLDLAAPKSFSEKLQWLKLHDRRPEYTRMVDKFEVKSWVASKIGAAHIVPNLGVWDSYDEIDFASLPEQFVLKCTHDSGGLVICKDRESYDNSGARTKISRSLARNFFRSGREWPYRDVNPRVLAEVYFPSWVPEGVQEDTRSESRAEARKRVSHEEAVERNGVFDYKFYCFHGEPQFLYVSQGLHNHATAEMVFLTLDWKRTGFARPDYQEFSEIPQKPDTLPEMIDIARKLSANIPFVRVDLFEHMGRVLFSEMTFHPVSGMMPVKPASADREIGDLLDLSHV